jgi:beta-glucanase (GH16 family)
MDWIQGYLTMEQWLNQYVGGHWTRWAWATQRDHNSWEACVAFKWEKHRTLFLLTWA